MFGLPSIRLRAVDLRRSPEASLHGAGSPPQWKHRLTTNHVFNGRGRPPDLLTIDYHAITSLHIVREGCPSRDGLTDLNYRPETPATPARLLSIRFIQSGAFVAFFRNSAVNLLNLHYGLHCRPCSDSGRLDNGTDSSQTHRRRGTDSNRRFRDALAPPTARPWCDAA